MKKSLYFILAGASVCAAAVIGIPRWIESRPVSRAVASESAAETETVTVKVPEMVTVEVPATATGRVSEPGPVMVTVPPLPLPVSSNPVNRVSGKRLQAPTGLRVVRRGG